MKTAFPGIDVSVVYAFLLFTMKSTIMFSAILSLCRFGDHVLSFSRLHGNDSGGSVGLRFSDFLRLFLFFFIYSFIYLFIYFILFHFALFSFYFMLFYFLFIHLFFHRNDRPEIGKRIRRSVTKKEGGLTSFIDAWNFFGGHFEFWGQLVRGLELRNIRGMGMESGTVEKLSKDPNACRVIACSRRSDRGEGAKRSSTALHYPDAWKRLAE